MATKSKTWFWAGMLIAGSWCAMPAAAAAAAIDLNDWQEVETPSATAWTTADEAIIGKGAGACWPQLVSREALAPDRAAAFRTTVTIVKPAPDSPAEGGQAFCRYLAGRNDSGYDAGLVLHWTDRDHFYRVVLSSKYQEVALWKPRGGFLQVAPAAIPVGKPIALAITTQPGWVRVALDGQVVLEHATAVEPLAGGRFGLAVFNSECRFTPPQIERTAITPHQTAAHQPAFTLRQWHWMDWIFDGQVPVAHLDKNLLVLWEARGGRSYKPLAYWELHWKQYDGTFNYANKLDEMKVLEQGQQLRLFFDAKNPKREVGNRITLAVRYDPVHDSYVHDVESRMQVVPGQTWKYTADGLEYCNLIPYNVVGPSAPVQQPWPWEYRWIVYRDKDGRTYRQPIHHNGVPVAPVKPDGGFYTYLQAQDMQPYNLIVRFDNPADPRLNNFAGLCWWAYDIHFRYGPFPNGCGCPLPPDKEFLARYRVEFLSAAESAELLKAAEIQPGMAGDRELAVYVPGVNTFDLVRRLDAPHAEQGWVGGAVDRQVGRTDALSLRLSGKSSCRAITGSSYFMDGYRNATYEFSAWIKTQDVQPPGAGLYVLTMHGNQERVRIECPTRVTGTQDWTRVSFQPSNVNAGTWYVELGLELDGPGTAWFDDVEIREVPDTVKP
ncbi:MAG TPA: hypothetical protein PLF81_02750 [Candidatus Anammoximicrobium sp.]|nr:hypothetical protein [Candidatus Anammoximicrobium sp.]